MKERKETISVIKRILRGVTFNTILSGIRALARQFIGLFESVDKQLDEVEERLEPIETFVGGEHAPLTAQENVIERITVNGVNQDVVEKTVNIVVPEAEIDYEVVATREQVGVDILEAKTEILSEVTEDFKGYFEANNKDSEILVKVDKLEEDLLTGIEEIKAMILVLHPESNE